MSEITHSDLLTIVSAAFAMARQDAEIQASEQDFLKRMIGTSGISQNDIDLKKKDFHDAASGLSSKKAKQVFLLSLAAVAKADGTIDPGEKKFIYDMARDLGVGIVDLDKHTKETLEKIVLDHLHE